MGRTVVTVNYIFASLLWRLGALTFLLNVFRVWGFWNIAGFAFHFYTPVAIVAQIVHIVMAFLEDKQDRSKFVKMTVISLLISIAVTIFTYSVSFKWG